MAPSLPLSRSLFLGAALALLAPLEAAAARIDCPLPQVRREITTALPSGWWNTPIVNSLTGTRVQAIAGRPALICEYGPAGTVQRYAPASQSCRAVAGGFDCQSAAPRTFSTMSLDIPQTWTADLDRGSVGARGEADIWFEAETRDLLYITPRNGAVLGVGDRSNRGYSGCSAARYSSARVSLRDIPVGSYVCVRTNENRFSQFRVNAISAGSPKTLSIGYTTWQ